MQQYFTLPGYQGECAPARGLIGPINRLCDAVRVAGGTVVWVQTASATPTRSGRTTTT